jgi:hypothetical protein
MAVAANQGVVFVKSIIEPAKMFGVYLLEIRVSSI